MLAPSPHHRRPDTDTVPPWVAYSGVLVVGGTALVVLAYYQHLLGVLAGMPGVLSWSFSIGLDWGSAVGGVFWFFGRGPLKAWGRAAAIVLLIGSTTITCLAWGMTSGWSWAPLGVIHPAVAFLMAKLLTVWQADRVAQHAETVTAPRVIAELRAELAAARAELATRNTRPARPARTPAVAPAPTPSAPAPAAPGEPDLERAVAFMRANPGAGRRKLAEHFGWKPEDNRARTLHPKARELAEQALTAA